MVRTLSLLLGAVVLWSAGSAPLAAQEVLQDTPDSGSPPAQIGQAAWLAGNWQGVSDEGDEVLESWLGPKGGMMAGVVLNTEKSEERGSESQWSEHMVIVSEGQSLAFHYDVFDAIVGGGSFIKRRLLRIEGDGCKLFFQAITFECKRDEDAGKVVGMIIYWQEPADEWNPEPELFTYRYTRVR
jgi:Domain of unknown function (DUF6265)